MFDFFGDRRVRPEKEKALRDIVNFFAHGVELTEGEIKVYESADDDGMVWVRIHTGFILEYGSGLEKLSDFLKNIYYMNMEPDEGKIKVYIAIKDVFEK